MATLRVALAAASLKQFLALALYLRGLPPRININNSNGNVAMHGSHVCRLSGWSIDCAQFYGHLTAWERPVKHQSATRQRVVD
jgi:hypothetical protein